MRFFVLLSALLSVAAGLQGPVEYEYQYEARVGSGIQASRPQYAGTGIRAKVKLSIRDEQNNADIQISDIQVGEKSQVLAEDGRQPLGIQYQPIKDKSLELPFVAHLQKKDGETVMEVPQNDLLWVTNVRRGVANFFRIAPIIDPSSVRPNQGQSEVEAQSFSRMEDTYAGRCRVAYSLSKAAPSDMSQGLHEDIQSMNTRKGPGGRQIQLSEEFYRVQSSVDFSSCKDRVALLQAGSTNMTNITDTQFREVAVRNHGGQYVLKGSPGQFRIEFGIVEAQMILEPFGVNSDKLITFSNQTMQLMATRHIPGGLHRSQVGSTKEIKTWAQQVQSPNQEPKGHVPKWVEYKKDSEESNSPIFYERLSSGFQITPQFKSNIQQRVQQALSRAAQQLQVQNKDSSSEPQQYKGSEDGRAVQSMQEVHKLIRALPMEILKQIDQQLQQQSSQCKLCHDLYVDALAVAGSGASLELLVEKLQANQLSDNRTASIFVSLANNVQSPEAVDKLMNFAMSLQEEQKSLVSVIVKPNLAILIRRLCISEQEMTYSHMREMFGEKQCDKQTVVQKYLPHLEQKIKSSDMMWVKILNVLAAADLGAPESLDILEQVARGKITEDLFVRYAAIHGMSVNTFDNCTHDQIFNILQPIAESQAEDYRIRQVAYDTLLSWKPNVTFIQRMASSARNDASKQIQSYIYNVIDSLATIDDPEFLRLSSAARNMRQITGLMSPTVHRAFSYKNARYLAKEQVGGEGEIAWFTGLRSYFPREIYTYAVAQLGKFRIPLFESMTFGNVQSAYSYSRDILASMRRIPAVVSAERQERRSKIHQQIRASQQSDQNPDIYYYARLFKTSEIFLPLTDDLYNLAKERSDEMVRKYSQQSRSDDQDQHEQMSLESQDYEPRQEQRQRHQRKIQQHQGQAQQDQDYQRADQQNQKQNQRQNQRQDQDQDRYQIYKYFNPIEINVILPTSVGLFTHTEVSTPTLIYVNMRTQMKLAPRMQDTFELPKLRQIDISAQGIAKAITKVNTYTYVYAPWTNKTVVAAVDNEKSVSLPLKLRMAADVRLPVQQLWAQITPLFNQTSDSIPVMKIRNVPFTGVAKILPSPVHPGSFEQFQKVQWVYSDNQLIQKTMKISQDATGLNAEVKYVGEPDMPINQPNSINLFLEPSRLAALLSSPSVKNYDLTLYQKPGDSPTKNIGVALRHIVKRGNSDSPIQVPEDSLKPIDVSPEDSLEERLDKVQKFSGQNNHEFSAHLNFTGTDTKIYEAGIIAAEQERAVGSEKAPRSFYKVQGVLLEKNSKSSRKPKTCMVFVTDRPQLIPASVLQATSDSDRPNFLQSQIAANIYEGSSCSSSQQPTVKGEADLIVSDNRLKSMFSVSKSGDFSFTNASALFRLAVYDRMRLQVDWQTPSPALKNVTLRIKDLAEGYLFPKIVKNRMTTNQENRMVVRADRSISDDRVDAWIELPKETNHAERVKVRAWFDHFTGFNPNIFAVYNSLSPKTLKVADNQCHITADQVKTFDGSTVSKMPTNCETVALQVEQGKDKILVTTRQYPTASSLQQLVKLLSADDGLEIIAQGQNIKINGKLMPPSDKTEEVKDEASNVIAKVTKSGNTVKINLLEKVTVILQDGTHLIIKTDNRYKSATAGLCGRFDGETENDLVEREGCVFPSSNGPEFAASWVNSEDQCDEEPMKKLFEDVHKFKSQCTPGSKPLSSSTDCGGLTGYPIEEIQGVNCVSVTEERVCQPNCLRSNITKMNNIMFKCWRKGNEPQEIIDNKEVGYLTHPCQAREDFKKYNDYMAPMNCTAPSLSAHGGLDPECFIDVYPVSQEGPQLCVSPKTQRLCKPDCKVIDTIPQQVLGKCYNFDQAPQTIVEARQIGYMTSLPEKASTDDDRILTVQSARLCVKAQPQQ